MSTVTALRVFAVGSRLVQPGETVELDEDTAAALARCGKAQPAPAAPVAEQRRARKPKTEEITE